MTFAMRALTRRCGAVAFYCLLSLSSLHAQGTLVDYQRAHDLRDKARDLVVDTPGAVTWIGNSDHFWYPKSVKGGTEFVLVDAEAGTKKPAFDQDKLAAAISNAIGHPYTGLKLPFAPMQGRAGGGRPTPDAIASTAPLTFLDSERSIQFGVGGLLYKCSLADYACTKVGPIPLSVREGATAPEDQSLLNPEVSPEGPGGDPVDGLEYQPPAPQDGDAGHHDGRPSSCAPTAPSSQQTPSQERSAHPGVGSQIMDQLPPEPVKVCASFDGKYEALSRTLTSS